MWKLLQIELFKISRRPRTYIAFVAIAAIVFLIQFALKADGKSYIDLITRDIEESFIIDKEKALNGYFICFLLLNTLLVQVPVLVALIAGDSISGEANMGTLRLLVSKPISRTQLMLIKFLACFLFTVALLIWMAILALFGSMLIFGTDNMMVLKSTGATIIERGDVFWRYLAAFGYAILALTTVAALAFLLSVFAENSIGPIVATVCIVIVLTILSNLNVPMFDKTIRPWLFTTYMVGWKGFFYINYNDDGQTITGSVENWHAIKRGIFLLTGHIILFVGIAIWVFRKRDILS
ncbi:MAG: ABC transporter permease subunit [Chitinophagaceae bacterium]|nr:ABC transporter permease subunit [Chitinophagaceae bacterium]